MGSKYSTEFLFTPINLISTVPPQCMTIVIKSRQAYQIRVQLRNSGHIIIISAHLGFRQCHTKTNLYRPTYGRYFSLEVL